MSGRWDPSLAFVMAGAVAVSGAGFQIYRRRGRRPLLAEECCLPAAKEVDAPLLLGSALFGVGWGLGGLCPGPALANLSACAPPARSRPSALPAAARCLTAAAAAAARARFCHAMPLVSSVCAGGSDCPMLRCPHPPRFTRHCLSRPAAAVVIGTASGGGSALPLGLFVAAMAAGMVLTEKANQPKPQQKKTA